MTKAEKLKFQALQAELSQAKADIESLEQGVTDSLQAAKLASESEKRAIYNRTRLLRKTLHARNVIHSLLEILDVSEHPEG